jgi:CHAD domain-containing protein
MPSRPRIRLQPKASTALLEAWTDTFKRFNRARAAGLSGMTEPHVHALRLAARRCKPILDVLAALEGGDARWRRIRHRTQELLSTLGPLRDAQVRRIRLGREAAPSPLREALERAARAETRKLLTPARAALRASSSLSRTLLAQELEGMRESGADRLARAIDRRIDQRLRKLIRAWHDLDDTDAEALHRARVSLKNHRLLLVALAPALLLAGDAELKAMKQLQDALGDYNDEHLFLAWLKAHGKGGTALARRTAARLAEQQRAIRAAIASGRMPTLDLLR